MQLKLFIAVFIVAVVARLWVRRQRGDVSRREAALWTFFWSLVLAAALWPHATDRVAWWFGIGRGADLLIFLSIVAVFALVSWLLARVGKIEREITEIVRQEALRSGELGIKNKESGNRIDPAGPTA